MQYIKKYLKTIISIYNSHQILMKFGFQEFALNSAAFNIKKSGGIREKSVVHAGQTLSVIIRDPL